MRKVRILVISPPALCQVIKHLVGGRPEFEIVGSIPSLKYLAQEAGRLLPELIVANMKPGAVLVDIAIDQGGCFEDSHPTTHDDPTFAVHDTLFYCVANMPASVPKTSTFALTNATMPYAIELADNGWQAACRSNPALAKGLSTHDGALLCKRVAADLALPFTDPAAILA